MKDGACLELAVEAIAGLVGGVEVGVHPGLAATRLQHKTGSHIGHGHQARDLFLGNREGIYSSMAMGHVAETQVEIYSRNNMKGIYSIPGRDLLQGHQERY